MSVSRVAQRFSTRLASSVHETRVVLGRSGVHTVSPALWTPMCSYSTHSQLFGTTPLSLAPKTPMQPTSSSASDTMPHSAHFDVQDIDANRLTHYYWDKDLEEDVISPYDYAMLLDEMNEWGGESIQFVEIDDRELLNSEYLQ